MGGWEREERMDGWMDGKEGRWRDGDNGALENRWRRRMDGWMDGLDGRLD